MQRHTAPTTSAAASLNTGLESCHLIDFPTLQTMEETANMPAYDIEFDVRFFSTSWLPYCNRLHINVCCLTILLDLGNAEANKESTLR